MFDNDDRAYWLRRAREERDLGNHCEDNAVALIHLRFADEYERRAAQPAAQILASAS